jgi:hypothetical protein
VAGTAAPRGRRLSPIAALVVLAFVVFAPVVARYSAQPASRYALTAAVAEHRTVDLGRYERILGVDRARYAGRTRSDKAPGQPLLAVPFYALGRVMGADSATELNARGDLGLWWSTFWTSFVPFLVLLVLMYRFTRRFAPDRALVASASIGFGTLMLPHAVNLYGHLLAAVLGFGAYSVVSDRRPASPARLFLGGALAGSAVLGEYQTAIVAIVVFVTVLQRERLRAVLMLAGAVPLALVLALYQWRAFGAPWHTPFAYYTGVLNGTSRGGYTLPGWHNLDATFVGTRGLLLVSPVILVALGGALWVAGSVAGEARRHAIVALVIAAAYLVLAAGWSGTPLLEEPGPRYMIPAFAFLALPLALVWPRIPRVCAIAAIWGAVLMTIASLTYVLLVVGENPTRYFAYVVARNFSRNLWTMAFGRAGVALYLATVAAAGRLVWRTLRTPASDEQVFASEVPTG